jgi:hypothetical protein
MDDGIKFHEFLYNMFFYLSKIKQRTTCLEGLQMGQTHLGFNPRKFGLLMGHCEFVLGHFWHYFK